MMEANKKPEDVRIDHRNNLWFLYRQIAEQKKESARAFHLYDKIEDKKER